MSSASLATPAVQAQLAQPVALADLPNQALHECIAYLMAYIAEREAAGLAGSPDTEYHRAQLLRPLVTELRRRLAAEAEMLAAAHHLGATAYLAENPRVILSSPLIFAGTTCAAREIPFPASLRGMVSHVGHPATRALLEALGATTDGEGSPGTYAGPAIGESFLAVPLAANPRATGWTVDQAIESAAELRAILVTRIA